MKHTHTHTSKLAGSIVAWLPMQWRNPAQKHVVKAIHSTSVVCCLRDLCYWQQKRLYGRQLECKLVYIENRNKIIFSLFSNCALVKWPGLLVSDADKQIFYSHWIVNFHWISSLNLICPNLHNFILLVHSLIHFVFLIYLQKSVPKSA